MNRVLGEGRRQLIPIMKSAIKVVLRLEKDQEKFLQRGRYIMSSLLLRKLTQILRSKASRVCRFLLVIIELRSKASRVSRFLTRPLSVCY